MNIAFVRSLALSLLLLSNLLVWCQKPNRAIDFKNPDVTLLESLIREKINSYRQEAGLHKLNQDSILHEAAKSQAKYNYKNASVESNQKSKKLATPALRVNHFGGYHSHVNELNNVIVMEEKTRVKGIRGRVILTTYEEAANAIVAPWINGRNLKALLKNEDLYTIGTGVVFVPDQKLIIATLVMASETYRKVPNTDYSKKSFKIKPYNKDVCKKYEREFGYLPELLSSSIKVEQGKIHFNFHDLTLLSTLLNHRKDGLAVDLVLRNQFSCGEGNREHPAPVETGLLLKPVYKGKLLRKNPLKEDNAFSAYLGDIPPQLEQEEMEINLVVIQEKCHCESILPNNVGGKNLKLLDIDFAIDTISISEDIDSLSRQINFTIPFEKNKAAYEVEDIKPILDSIQLNRYDIKQINITAYASIEGNAANNERLQQQRAQSILSAIQQYQLQQVKTSITTYENWDGFYASIANSPYFEQFKGLDTAQTRALVNSDTLGYDLEPYLEDQRKAEVNIRVESIYIDSLNPEVLPEKFKKALTNNEHIQAKGIQSIMLTNVAHDVLEDSVLFPTYQIAYYPENMPIMNNILAAKAKYNPKKKEMADLFEELKEEINRFSGIAPDNAHLLFNKQLVELYYWSENIHYLMVDEEAKIDQPKDLYKAIRKLYNTKIDNWKVNQLMLNYYIIAADFYYEHKDYAAREKSLKKVKRLVERSKLDQEQTYTMAGYFMFQMRMDWAIEIMLPFIESGDFSEDFLFRLLSIAIYDEKQVPETRFIRYLNMAKTLNEERYCALFGAPNMSFQLFENKTIKADFCATCNP
jgi:outer membrane protein OmpA-like peptidoglycan-associated protein/uncharacterized protein YkwD